MNHGHIKDRRPDHGIMTKDACNNVASVCIILFIVAFFAVYPLLQSLRCQ